MLKQQSLTFNVQVMILSHDRDRGRVSLSTKKLEPTPGDMIRNPKLVFEKVTLFPFKKTFPIFFYVSIICYFLLSQG